MIVLLDRPSRHRRSALRSGPSGGLFETSERVAAGRQRMAAALDASKKWLDQNDGGYTKDLLEADEACLQETARLPPEEGTRSWFEDAAARPGAGPVERAAFCQGKVKGGKPRQLSTGPYPRLSEGKLPRGTKTRPRPASFIRGGTTS